MALLSAKVCIAIQIFLQRSFSELHCNERWFPSREGVKTAFTIHQFLSAENLIIVNLDCQEGYARANSDPIVLKLSDNYRISAKNGQKHFMMTYKSRFFFAVTLRVLVCLFITVAGFYLVILAGSLTGGDT